MFFCGYSLAGKFGVFPTVFPNVFPTLFLTHFSLAPVPLAHRGNDDSAVVTFASFRNMTTTIHTMTLLIVFCVLLWLCPGW